MKHWLHLFDWFNRARVQDIDGIPAVAVTPDRAREARLYLREHSAFDFEKFRSTLQIDQIMHAPLGDTAECLSAEDLATMVQSHAMESPVMLDSALIDCRVTHIQHCEACFQNITLFQEMEHQSFERAHAKGVKGLPLTCWIEPVGRVEVIGNAEPVLGLVLAMPRDQAWTLDSPADIRARLSCPFETGEVKLYQVDTNRRQKTSWFRPWRPASAVKWTEQGSEEFILGYYRTEQLRELEGVKDQMCGFVTVSQRVGDQELRSTQVIRLERG